MPFMRSPSKIIHRSMDRLRRSFRESFRRRGSKERVTESAKPHEWQQDEQAVRAGTCSFPVKYLGGVEVFESRGMQVCEEAMKVLRAGRRHRIRGLLYVSGDGLRVGDNENKGLVVDQTIEKVSFCAPDRNHERGFAYICRDGTTRRWMCHGFHAVKDSGERLSHAVGCAFAVCLEKKQRRDRESGGTSSSTSITTHAAPIQPTPIGGNETIVATVADVKAPVNATAASQQGPFQRAGSFRQASLSERILDPQNVKPAEKPPVKPTVNPHAVARPHANPSLFERQGSLRLGCTNAGAATETSPFKRNFSVRVNELPSTLARYNQVNGGASGQNAGKVGFVPPPMIAESEQEQFSRMDLNGGACPGLGQFSTNDVHGPSKIGVASGSSQTNKSRADEWLESVATTVLKSGRGDTPPVSALHQNNFQQQGQFANAMNSNATFINSNMGHYTPPPMLPQHTLNSNASFVANSISSAPAKDIFGQPVFNAPPVPQRPPHLSHQNRSQSLATSSPLLHGSGQYAQGNAAAAQLHHSHTLDMQQQNVTGGFISQPVVDGFEAKWQSLAATQNATTNPFSQESAGVNV